MLIVPHLVKKLPILYGIKKFITVFTSANHMSWSWTRLIQYTPSHPASWSSILISSHLRLGVPNDIFSSGFPIKILYSPLSSPIRATCPAHLIRPDLITRIIAYSVSSTYRKVSRAVFYNFLLLLISNLLCNYVTTPQLLIRVTFPFQSYRLLHGLRMSLILQYSQGKVTSHGRRTGN